MRDSMLCPKCKSENPAEANFCRHCGHQFNEIQAKSNLIKVRDSEDNVQELTLKNKELNKALEQISKENKELKNTIKKSKKEIKKLSNDYKNSYFEIERYHNRSILLLVINVVLCVILGILIYQKI